MSRQTLILVAVAVLAAGGGYLAAMRLAGPPDPPPAAAEPAPTPDALVGRLRPGFQLQGADGRPVRAEDFDGRPLLLNFWATWCKPCVEEMPMLGRLREAHAVRGFEVVGIAVDEPERARAFAAQLGLDYPLLFGAGEAMLIGRRDGTASGMLPYSVLNDAGGVVRWTHLGALSRAEVEKRLAELPGMAQE